jgi:EmrB/QacA subfamily drug resistance transporter
VTRYRHLITDANRKWWTLGAMCFALFMIMLDNTVVNVALPSIQRDLGASISGLEWTINGYTLSFAVLLATGGRLGDIFGRRRMFLFGVVIFALSSATAGLAASSTDLVLSRVVQGVGAALMMPATLSIITDAFPAHERGKAMGMWAGVSALALAVGPVLGGFLTEHVSWRAIFYLNIPVAAGAIAASLFAVRESRDTTVGREVDYPGVAILTAALTALILALVEGNSWGWGSVEIVALLVGAVVGLALFVAVELRVRTPMIEFHFFADRNFLGAVVVALIVSFAMLGVFFFLALYMQDILGYSPLEAGVRFLPSTLMIVTVAPIAGRLSDRFGPRWLIAAGLAIVAGSLYTFSGIAVDSSYMDLLPGFMMLGIGIALTMSPMTSAAMNAVAVEKAGIASGVLSMFRMVGGSLGVAVTGAIFQGLIRSELDSQLAGTGVSAAQRSELAHQFGAASSDALHGMAPAQAKQVVAAGQEAFVYALGHAMAVSAGVALAGALIAALAIRVRRRTGESGIAEGPSGAARPAEAIDRAGGGETADGRDSGETVAGQNGGAEASSRRPVATSDSP